MLLVLGLLHWCTAQWPLFGIRFVTHVPGLLCWCTALGWYRLLFYFNECVCVLLVLGLLHWCTAQ